ncbi:MAG: hypothetical protein ACR2QM_15020 [Longimicrobiales bacterium]
MRGHTVGIRAPLVAGVLITMALLGPGPVSGQEATDTTSLGTPSLGADEAQAVSLDVPPPPGLPVFVTLGFGFGQRKDGCSLCGSPLDTKSFTGHLSVGRHLTGGLGIGVDVSAWRRGRPGTPAPADSTGVPVGVTLTNMLGNASVTASYQFWHAFARVGAGFAWGHQDIEEPGEADDVVVLRASGKGIGYSVGGGLMLPVHSLVSLVAFGNWNAGQYDLNSVNGVLARESKHRYYEVGVGVTIR